MSRILVTGATSGIGLAAAARLAEQPNDLVLHGPQSEPDAVEAISLVEHRAHPHTRISYLPADFTRLESVRHLAHQLLSDSEPVGVLVNNAAIPGPPSPTMGSAGTEVTYQVNFLAGTLLTHLLLPGLEPDGRIVNVGSATHLSATLDLRDLDFHDRTYSPADAYAQSKLAIITYSNWLAAKIGQAVLSIHPGVVSTGLLHAMFSVGGVPASVGGDNLANAAVVDAASGTYFDESTPASPSTDSRDPRLQAALVEDTQARLAVSLH
jgi:NAD(P)-dependent dehydrogenase (short-subunit alcohol dehydrogenase family)